MSAAGPEISQAQQEAVLRRFEEAWKAGTPPELRAHLPSLGEHWQNDRVAHNLVVELLAIDLEYRWLMPPTGPRGSLPPRPRLEDYARAFPQLGPAERLPLDLILAEYDARKVAGSAPALDELVARFPMRADMLGSIIRQRVDSSAEAGVTCSDNDSSTKLQLPGSVAPAAEILPVLEALQLLTKPQFEELKAAVAAGQLRTADELLTHARQRTWLTPFQTDQLLQGRGAQLVQGSYVLLAQLGEGGMSRVFLARHRHMQRTVAFKVIRRQLIDDAGDVAVRRFYQEIQAVGRLSHPNIIHAYDAGPIAGTHFIAMEYVEGTDLGRLVRRNGPLPVAHACEYIRQAALGLQHAFECGLVHRDLKPSNLLLESGHERIKILDLGLASLSFAEQGRSRTGLTETGSFLGTPDYIAPEQAADPTTADIRADLYSLGCTLYHLLSGTPPFPGGTMAHKLNRHQLEAPPPISHARPDVPADVAAIVHRLLEKSPDDRFQTPLELAQALASVAVVGRTSGPPSRQKAPPTTGKAGSALRIAAVAVVALVLLVGGAFFLVRYLSNRASASRPTAANATSKPLVEPVSSALSALTGNSLSPEDRALANKGLVAVLHGTKPTFANPITPAGNVLVTGGPSETAIHIWDIKDGKIQERCQIQTGGIHGAALTPDGQKLIATGNDGDARLWDLSSTPPRLVQTFPGVGGCFETAIFSPDGKTLALGGTDGRIRLYDMTPKVPTLLHELSGHATHIESLAYSRDGKLLASGSADGVIYLWDCSGMFPRERGVLRGHTGMIFGLGFSPDGKTLASGSTDNSVRWWDISGSRPRATRVLNEHARAVVTTSFTNDGKLFYTAGNDGRVIAWALPSLVKQDEWKLPGPIHRGILTADQHHFLAANDNGTMAIIRVAPR
jgi:serine/threonine protein kinase